jgi:hypothetical protein
MGMKKMETTVKAPLLPLLMIKAIKMKIKYKKFHKSINISLAIVILEIQTAK